MSGCGCLSMAQWHQTFQMDALNRLIINRSKFGDHQWNAYLSLWNPEQLRVYSITGSCISGIFGFIRIRGRGGRSCQDSSLFQATEISLRKIQFGTISRDQAIRQFSLDQRPLERFSSHFISRRFQAQNPIRNEFKSKWRGEMKVARYSVPPSFMVNSFPANLLIASTATQKKKL